MVKLSVASLLLLSLLHQSYAARSISAKKVRNPNTSRAADRYDRSITTFTPEGRLLQLEYSLIAAEERGRGLTVCVEWEGVVIFAFPSSDYDNTDGWSFVNEGDGALPHTSDDTSYANDICDESEAESSSAKSTILSSIHSKTLLLESITKQNQSHNTKVHRLSPTHLLLTSGLAGDSRTLASAFRRMISSWTHINYGEVVTAREVAKEVGKVRHGIGLRPGARVLGVVGMVIGLEDTDDFNEEHTQQQELGVEVRMYRSLPGGTIDRCNVCCTGGGADAAGCLARKEAMETLQKLVSATECDGENDNEQSNELHGEGNETSDKEVELQRIIEEVGRVALKYHPDAREEDYVVAKDKGHKRVSVDIWVVKAAPARTVDNDGYMFVNPHRHLGKAIMQTRLARRVALNQLTDATKCLIVEDT